MWVREEANGNVCLGNREAVQDRVGKFLAVLTGRKDEVRRRCGTVLQSGAGALLRDSRPDSRRLANAHPTLALVYVRSSGNNTRSAINDCYLLIEIHADWEVLSIFTRLIQKVDWLKV